MEISDIKFRGPTNESKLRMVEPQTGDASGGFRLVETVAADVGGSLFEFRGDQGLPSLCGLLPFLASALEIREIHRSAKR